MPPPTHQPSTIIPILISKLATKPRNHSPIGLLPRFPQNPSPNPRRHFRLRASGNLVREEGEEEPLRSLTTLSVTNSTSKAKSKSISTSSRIIIAPIISTRSYDRMMTTSSAAAAAPVVGTEKEESLRDVVFSSNADPNELRPQLEELLQRWQLTSKHNGLERSFRFKTFKKTWEFMNAIAAECALKKHHPEWSNVYNTTFIRWTTHSPPGLSAKDVQMAKICDELAVGFGEVVSDAKIGAEVNKAGKELADVVAVAGGECCVPSNGRGNNK